MYRLAAIILGATVALLITLIVGLQLGSSGAVKAPLNHPAGATSLPSSSTGSPQLSSPSGSAVGASDAQTIRSINVSGEGTAIANPDIVKVDLGVDMTNRTLTAARDEAASKMNAIIQKLKDMGVADKDIKTINYSVFPQQDYNSNTVEVVGFQVTQIVEVTIRDVSKVGSIVDAVVDLGANNISGINFTIEDMAPLQAQAREKAMADAKAKADQLAKLAGVTLGPVFSVSESIGFVPFPIPYAQPAMAGGATAPSMAAPASGAPSAAASSAAIAAPIQPGQLEVQVDVSVVYSIQ